MAMMGWVALAEMMVEPLRVRVNDWVPRLNGVWV